MPLTIATWNVERVSLGSWKRLPSIREAMAAVDADIWVLTETREGLSPADGYYPLHAPAWVRKYRGQDERMVSIWSRWPIQPTDLEPRSRGAVSGVVQTPDGPVAVFGSVIPYANDKGPDGEARMWDSHLAEIERLAVELPALTEQMAVVLAGDLNQDRDGSGWYGTKKVRAALSESLAAADMTCLTDKDVVAAGKLERHHLIDHVCTSNDLIREGWTVDCWEPINDDGVRMSDHPGVVVTIA